MEAKINVHTAILAKEKQFNVGVWGSLILYKKTNINDDYPHESYKEGQVDTDDSYFMNNNKSCDFSNETYDMYARPTLQELQWWLRTEKKISVIPKHYYSGKFTFEILRWSTENGIWEKVTGFMEKTSLSYEEALEDGLQHGLKLIEK